MCPSAPARLSFSPNTSSKSVVDLPGEIPRCARQEPRARPDVGVGDLGRSGRLRHLRTACATLPVPSITMDVHTRRRDVFDRVFVKLARVFERPTAIETDPTLFGTRVALLVDVI